MQCAKCGHHNLVGTKFCGGCGARLTLVCAACGTSNPADNKFCGECGNLLGQASPTHSPITTKFSSPQAYTPRHLAERILSSKSGLEGERKQVTVLFADLKGSMELLADRDPEEARALLDPVLELMMEAVHRYEGTVNQVMGDGVMALFGAPLAHEDHAVRACYAALRMQDAVKRHSEEVRRNIGVPVSIRVGLNSGEVVVGSIGSDLHMDYTAVGQTTHLAARMEQAALPGSILISADTLRLAEGYVQVRPLGQVNVKGLEEPVEMYEVTGAGPVRTRLQVAAARGLTRFVGRDAEVEQLCRALEKAGQGHGQMAAVVGEPGVGKSRLFYEFARSHRTQAWLLLESGSVSYGKATAYLPVIELLKTYCEIETRDDTRKVREKVTGKLLTLDRSLESLLPALLVLLDVPTEDATWQALDPPQRHQRTLDAVKRLLVRESQVQPLLLIFEDLHWIDTETQSLLDSLIESLPTSRVLLLVNYRPEYQHSWGSKTYYSQLRLDALPPESAGELLHALLGGASELEPLKQILITRTEGNPFFLEESVRMLVETKALVGKHGAYALAKPLQTLHVPATVQAVLAARIDRLPADEKSLLQSAAVIGKDMAFPLLQAIAELPEEELRRGLTHLRTAEFLYETSLFPDLEYTFKHALTHEVVYQSLLQDRRRALHYRIVDAIEQLYPDRLTEHVDRLAHHAFRGEMWDKTLLYSRQAGAKAFWRSANREAVTCFEQALVALKHLPENRDTIEQAVDLRFELRNALWLLGELAQILERLGEAESLATALGDQRRLGWVFGYMTNSFAWAGDYRRALESGQRALAIANGLGDFALQVATALYLGLVHCSLGDYRRAMDFLGRAVASLEGDLLRERFGLPGLPSVLCRTWLVWCLAQVGEFADGTTRGEEAVRIAEAVDQPYTLVYAYIGLGDLYLHRGDFHQAARLLEQGLELCRVGNIRRLFVFVASRLGSAYAQSGRVVDALPLLEQAVEHAVSMSMMGHQSISLAWLSETYLLAGRVDDALSLAERALHLSRTHKEQGNEAWALHLLGEIAAHHDPGNPAKAENYYRQAMGLADQLEMRPLVAHCHIGLSKLYRRRGDSKQVREHLITATTMYHEMDLGFWLEKAEAELRELR